MFGGCSGPRPPAASDLPSGVVGARWGPHDVEHTRVRSPCDSSAASPSGPRTVARWRSLPVSGDSRMSWPICATRCSWPWPRTPVLFVCDLIGVTDGSDADAGLLLATIGQQVRATGRPCPVALACPDPDLRHRLRQQPLSEHVLLRARKGQAMAAVGRTAPPATARLGLAPHVTASRVARDFVSRTCLDWGLAPAIASACLVVSELRDQRAAACGHRHGPDAGPPRRRPAAGPARPQRRAVAPAGAGPGQRWWPGSGTRGRLLPGLGCVADRRRRQGGLGGP